MTEIVPVYREPLMEVTYPLTKNVSKKKKLVKKKREKKKFENKKNLDIISKPSFFNSSSPIKKQRVDNYIEKQISAFKKASSPEKSEASCLSNLRSQKLKSDKLLTNNLTANKNSHRIFKKTFKYNLPKQKEKREKSSTFKQKEKREKSSKFKQEEKRGKINKLKFTEDNMKPIKLKNETNLKRKQKEKQPRCTATKNKFLLKPKVVKRLESKENLKQQNTSKSKSVNFLHDSPCNKICLYDTTHNNNDGNTDENLIPLDEIDQIDLVVEKSTEVKCNLSTLPIKELAVFTKPKIRHGLESDRPENTLDKMKWLANFQHPLVTAKMYCKQCNCDMKTLRVEKWMDHYSRCHNFQPYKCRKCNKTYRQALHYHWHMEKHKNEVFYR